LKDIITIIGLGYVGLPLAVEFSKKYRVIGFDIFGDRIDELKNGYDRTLEVSKDCLADALNNKILFTAYAEDIKDANIFIVTVPTPIDEHKRPNLTPLIKASQTVGKALKKGDIVKSGDIVARTNLPGKVHSVNVVNRLAILPGDLRKYMLKKEGESVQKDELIAETRPFIKMFKSICLSPITGNIESISDITGQVLLREPPKPVKISAYIDGKVV